MKNDFRIINKFLAVVSIIILTTFNSFAQGPRKAAGTSFDEGPLTYTVISDADKTVRVTGFQKDYSEEVLDIPETVWHFETYTVTEISKVILSQSSNFKVLNVPASVENIEISEERWNTCNMEEINVAEGNRNYTSVDGILYDKELTVLLLCPVAMEKEIRIPETVTIIGPNAFSYCNKLGSVALPDNVVKIDERGFAYSSLSEIKLPDTLEYIGSDAFIMTNIKSLYIPDSVTHLGSFVCAICESLSEVRLPENGQIKELNCPVYHCPSLKSFRIPEGVERLVNWFNFSGCDALETLYIPASFIDFGEVTFCADYSLVNFIIDENNQAFTSDGPMLLSKDKTVLVAFPSASGEMVIQDGIKVVGNNAFGYCKITQLTLPASLTDINGFAFNCCSDLKSIIMLSPEPPYLSYSAFSGEATGGFDPYYQRCNIFVPKESLQAYKDTGWETKFPYLHIYSLDWLAGIEDTIINEEMSYTVYSVDGRLVLKDSPRDNVNKLPKGFYIINGKKVLLGR